MRIARIRHPVLRKSDHLARSSCALEFVPIRPRCLLHSSPNLEIEIASPRRFVMAAGHGRGDHKYAGYSNQVRRSTVWMGARESRNIAAAETSADLMTPPMSIILCSTQRRSQLRRPLPELSDVRSLPLLYLILSASENSSLICCARRQLHLAFRERA